MTPTHYKGKRLSAIDMAQNEKDRKHDAQFMAMFLINGALILWCSMLTFAVLQK